MVPASFITEKYPQADAGSRFSVSYNMYKAPSTYLADFKNLKEYTLSNADYKRYGQKLLRLPTFLRLR